MALRCKGRKDFHWLWYSRRLAEFYTISILNRIERNQIDHLKEQQKKKNYRRTLAKDYIDAISKDMHKKYKGKLGQVFLMPSTFAGSTRYYQEKYADFMTIVRHVGTPTWLVLTILYSVPFQKYFRFVTFTGNPDWPEIIDALKEKQEYMHMPNVVCRIFMDKADEFLHDVIERQVLGKVSGFCFSVEHQKRGSFFL
jgi:hypothetical protein